MNKAATAITGYEADEVTALNRKLADGSVTLKFDPVSGYLRSVLADKAQRKPDKSPFVLEAGTDILRLRAAVTSPGGTTAAGLRKRGRNPIVEVMIPLTVTREELQLARSWVEEEIAHAMKIFDFVIDRDARVKLSAIAAPSSNFASPLDVLKKALEHERSVTGKINELYTAAKEENDYPTEALMQWFVLEQVAGGELMIARHRPLELAPVAHPARERVVGDARDAAVGAHDELDAPREHRPQHLRPALPRRPPDGPPGPSRRRPGARPRAGRHRPRRRLWPLMKRAHGGVFRFIYLRQPWMT